MKDLTFSSKYKSSKIYALKDIQVQKCRQSTTCNRQTSSLLQFWTVRGRRTTQTPGSPTASPSHQTPVGSVSPSHGAGRLLSAAGREVIYKPQEHLLTFHKQVIELMTIAAHQLHTWNLLWYWRLMESKCVESQVIFNRAN